MVTEIEFNSPIGKVTRSADGIVHVHITEQELTVPMLVGHYANLDKFLGVPKCPFILTFEPSYLKMDASTRRYNNDQMNHWSTAMAVVVENALIRAFVMMYMRINPLIYDIKICVSFEEASKWLIDNGFNEK